MSSQAPFRYSQKLRFLVDALCAGGVLASDAAVLACIVDHANAANGRCFVGLPLIATEAKVPRSTVRQAVRRLKAKGWLATEDRPGTSTLYILTRPVDGTGTGSVDGTGGNATTRSVRGLKRGRTRSVDGTPPVPWTEHEQEEQEEQEQQEEQRARSLRSLGETKNQIALVLKDGSSHTVTHVEEERLRLQFPKVDVRHELLAAQAWCDAKPNRRKTKTGIRAFIAHWLTNASKPRPGAQPPARGVAASFKDVRYIGTPDDELPDWLRPATDSKDAA